LAIPERAYDVRKICKGTRLVLKFISFKCRSKTYPKPIQSDKTTIGSACVKTNERQLVSYIEYRCKSAPSRKRLDHEVMHFLNMRHYQQIDLLLSSKPRAYIVNEVTRRLIIAGIDNLAYTRMNCWRTNK
jgi:hypothetical protein